ncbi:zincin-like metallopeptidase domain-containing protein [Candidatus Methylospira mobilis]|uniref:ArdC family protein n=1 Tax=Candidatus Methylospira mobilis TaxID=1808979 RepID=UPI0028EA0688|nr:zincin-like metallopeptidase domain-containing protein [Candidatus Methylospira mobilis]WNV05921.1 zincin-like metallopeptidase domain-containing protein [Candidatus Methylospira mobilis]
MAKPSENQRRPQHEEIAEKLIEQLKAGTSPWQTPWDPSLSSGFSAPYNALTGSRYRGGNALWLMLHSQRYNDPRWLTFKQAQTLGAHVRKGERGTVIQYYKTSEQKIKLDEQGKPVKDEHGKAVKISVQLDKPRLFSANVFNAAQVEGLPPLNKPVRHEWEILKRAEHTLMASGVQIEHHDNGDAYYNVGTDTVHLPDKGYFDAPAKYYATALHELGHWTGAESRLNRDLSGAFGSEHYAREELRAEIASLMLGDELGTGHDFGQHAAYVNSWIDVLESDPMEIMRAASDAEHIRSYIMDFAPKLISQTELDIIAADIFAEQPSEEEQTERLAYRVALETAQVYRREHPSTLDPTVDSVLAQVDYLQQFVEQQPSQAFAVVQFWNETPRAFAAVADMSTEMIERYSVIVTTSIKMHYEAKMNEWAADKKGFEGTVFKVDDLYSTLSGKEPLSWVFVVDDNGAMTTAYLNGDHEVVFSDFTVSELSGDSMQTLYMVMSQDHDFFSTKTNTLHWGRADDLPSQPPSPSQTKRTQLEQLSQQMAERVTIIREVLRDESLDWASGENVINSEDDQAYVEYTPHKFSPVVEVHDICLIVQTSGGERFCAKDDFRLSPTSFVHKALNEFEIEKASRRKDKINQILDNGLAPINQQHADGQRAQQHIDPIKQTLYNSIMAQGVLMAESATQSEFVSEACCHIAQVRIAELYAATLRNELTTTQQIADISKFLEHVDAQVRDQVQAVIAQDECNRLAGGPDVAVQTEETVAFSPIS